MAGSDDDDLLPCRGKQAFWNKGEALRILKIRNRRRSRNDTRSPLQAYRCTFCGRWHHGGKL